MILIFETLFSQQIKPYQLKLCFKNTILKNWLDHSKTLLIEKYIFAKFSLIKATSTNLFLLIHIYI